MSAPNSLTPDKLFRLLGRPDTPVLVDVRAEPDAAADPRLVPGAAGDRPRRSPTGGRASPDAPSSPSAPRATRGAKASPPGCAQRGARAEILEGGHAAWRAAGLPLVPEDAHPAARRRRRDALGDPGAAEDRPDRLPLADPALRRPRGALPLRRAGRGDGGRRAVRRDALRHRGRRLLEPPRRALQLRRHGRRVRPRDRAARPARDASCAAPTPRGPSSRPKRPGCSPSRSGCRGCTPTTSRSSRPGCCSTTPSTAGAATRPARPTTGRATRCAP